MGAYSLGILQLLQFLFAFIFINELKAKNVAFAEDFTVAGKLTSTKSI